MQTDCYFFLRGCYRVTHSRTDDGQQQKCAEGPLDVEWLDNKKADEFSPDKCWAIYTQGRKQLFWIEMLRGIFLLRVEIWITIDS